MGGLTIDGVFPSSLEKVAKEKKAAENPIADFKKILNESIGEVNDQLVQAEADTREMIVGKKDIHQAMISMERASISMRLLIQVRNRIITAYEEIMRMQM